MNTQPDSANRHTDDTAPLTFITGDATNPDGDGPKIIAHVCNDIGGWGRGFVLAVSRRWPEPEASYRRWATRHAGHLPLGEIQIASVEQNLWVANMVAQHGVRSDNNGRPPIRYPALNLCLQELGAHARTLGASVHMPRIGSGLAGGNWSIIERMIRANLCHNGVSVTVYRLPER